MERAGWLRALGYWLLAIGYRLLATGYWLETFADMFVYYLVNVGFWLFDAYCSLFPFSFLLKNPVVSPSCPIVFIFIR